MAFTYPLAQLEGTLSAEDVHKLLASQSAVSRRVRDLASERFISDYLLAGRYNAVGGSVLYDESGNELYAADDPRAVAAGSEYPLTVMEEGELAAAKTTKWGHDSEVYDESIARRSIDPVNRTLSGLVNRVVRYVDGVSLGVIASKVTATYDSPVAWDTGAHIVESVLLAQATGNNQGDGGYDMSTVVVSPIQFAKVSAYLINGGFVGRENGDMIQAKLPIDALGLTWTTTDKAVFTDPMLVDREQLGGMGDEDLKSPGYSRGANGVGVETKVQRLTGADDRDGYRLRARRVTVPVVIDPMAALRITGTGA